HSGPRTYPARRVPRRPPASERGERAASRRRAKHAGQRSERAASRRRAKFIGQRSERAASRRRAKFIGQRSERAASRRRAKFIGTHSHQQAAVVTTDAGDDRAPRSEPEPELVRVTTIVPVDPALAFALFTDEVDAWWRRGPRYRFGDGALRFEPPPRGRLVEVYDEAA